MPKNMGYQQAKDIRSKSFGSLMSDKIVEGGGIFSSFGKTVSERSKAKMTGIKESFDPLNIAKFMTGGSSIGPAILGKLTGRSKEDMQYFTGKNKKGKTDTASKLGPLESGNEMIDILMKVYDLMKSTNDANIKLREKENNFKEETELERLRRHKQLMEAITGEKYKGKASAVKIPKIEASDPISDFISGLGGMAAGLTLLKTIGMFFAGSVGVALLGATSLGALFFAMTKAKPESHATANKVYGAMDSAGGAIEQLAANKSFESLSEDEKKAEVARRDRLNAALKSAPWKTKYFGYKIPEFLESKGYSPEQIEELTTRIQDRKTDTVAPTPVTPTSTNTQSVPQTTNTPTSTESTSAPISAVSAPPAPTQLTGAKLNNVTGENLDMKLEESIHKSTPESIVNTSMNTTNQVAGIKPKIPPVRNQEETFQRMLFNSTRVV